jgi:hypothetical protein
MQSHSFNVEFDRFGDQSASLFQCLRECYATGQIGNGRAHAGWSLFEYDRVSHVSMPACFLLFLSAPTWLGSVVKLAMATFLANHLPSLTFNGKGYPTTTSLRIEEAAQIDSALLLTLIGHHGRMVGHALNAYAAGAEEAIQSEGRASE